VKNRTFGLLPVLLAVCLMAAAGYGQWVEDSIDVGRWVGSLTYNSRTDVIYGASEQPGIFFAISCDSNKVISRIYLFSPFEIAYDSTDNKAYCTFGGCGDSVAVIDGSTHTKVRTIPLSGEPWATYLIWDPVSNRVYVSCGNRNRVAVIDCATDSVIDYIRVGRWPVGMDLNTRHHKLYVRNCDSESVSIIDLETNEVIRTIRLRRMSPEAGCYNPRVDRYYCSGTDNEVVAIDGAGDTIVSRIPLPQESGARAMVTKETSSLVMVAASSYFADSLLVVDAIGDSVVSVLSVGRSPSSLAWSPVTNLVYCANATSGNVSVIAGDGSRVVKTLRVAGYPAVLLAVPEYRRVYVGIPVAGTYM